MARNVIATDDFNRASLDGNWTAGINFTDGGDMSINSSIRITGAASSFGTEGIHAAARWIGAGTFTNDQYSSLKMLNLSDLWGNNYHIGVAVRMSADTSANRDYYEVYVKNTDPPATVLAKVVNGTHTVIHSSTTPTWANNDLISLEVEGTTLRACKNGTALGGSYTATDSDLSTGQPGAVCNSALYGDDWEGGSITASAAGSLRRKLLLGVG